MCTVYRGHVVNAEGLVLVFVQKTYQRIKAAPGRISCFAGVQGIGDFIGDQAKANGQDKEF